MSHLVWLGTSRARPRRDLDVLVLLPRPRADPRPVRDVLRPAHAHALLPGRRRLRGHPRRLGARRCASSPRSCPTRVDQFLALLMKNEIVLQRLRDVGGVDEQTLLDLGVTGPLLRATGNPWDLRKAEPYCSYEDFDFQHPGRHGRATTRTAIDRPHDGDAGESCGSSSRRSTGLPEGPYITDNRKYALPPRHELATSMEALIHHFKLVTEGFRVPPGEVYYPIESPRGELGVLPALRRLLQARARAHARPLVREPAGDAADGRRTSTSPTSSRRWRCSTRCSAGSTADMAIDPTRVRRFAHGLPRPRLGRRRRPDEGPGRRPRRRRPRPCPDELRAEIEAYMARYPDFRSAAIPALHAAQRLHGWCSPTAIEQVACVMRLTPGYLHRRGDVLRHVRHAPQGPARRLRVHEHLVLAARRGRALRGDAVGGRRRPATSTCGSFECLGACDIAPMASVDGEYVGPLDPGGLRRRSSRTSRRAGRCSRPSSCASAARPPASDWQETVIAT